MKAHAIPILLGLLAGAVGPAAAESGTPVDLAAPGVPDLRLPWRAAGLTEAQAAAHLLDRFAFGARPTEVERVVAMGLESWLAGQLLAEEPDPPQLAPVYARVPALDWTTRRVVEVYPGPGVVRREAERDGLDVGEPAEIGARPDGEVYRKLRAYAREKGFRPQRELLGGLMAQKLLRAVYSENQLAEVLADFWFNHFNVSITKPECRTYVATYERDAIRPHVLGRFRALLEATAKHPAMLLYLDNARSVAEEGVATTFEAGRYFAEQRRRYGRPGARGGARAASPFEDRFEDRRRDDRGPHGLNENYARELLELHTLGVDGGYSQDDIVAVARAFSGWTTYPPGARREQIEERVAQVHRFPDTGFVFEDELIFRANGHDAAPKTVLGRRLPAGRGIEDGLDVLDLLAAHPSTARHLARKLAVRFVSDDPPAGLVDRLAGVFLSTGGDLREMMVALAESPEFWSPGARRSKIKSPLEVAVSALRALDTEVAQPREILEWIARMGQPLYAYQAPTGYPDRAEAWVNSGSLLNRMSFGLELASGRIDGLRVDLGALRPGPEPASLEAALRAWVPRLLPERDPEPTVERLVPLIGDPALAEKLARAAPKPRPRSYPDDREALFWQDRSEAMADGGGETSPGEERWRRSRTRSHRADPEAYVVGIILGSPEFQRR